MDNSTYGGEVFLAAVSWVFVLISHLLPAFQFLSIILAIIASAISIVRGWKEFKKITLTFKSKVYAKIKSWFTVGK